MYKHLVFVFLGILVVSLGVGYADIPNPSRIAIEEAITPHSNGGARDFCSIVFYNLCRWTWTYSGFEPGDEVGVVYDLPLDCSLDPWGWRPDNVGFWWYWRYTSPGRGYTVSYALYELSDQHCKVGAPVGTYAHSDPTERWNHYPGFGMVGFPLASIIASFDKGGLPYLTTDNNVNNQGDPSHCPAYVPHTVPHSVAWRYGSTAYCPPVAFTDALGPVEILMDASFYTLEDAVRGESWTGVKKLFR